MTNRKTSAKGPPRALVIRPTAGEPRKPSRIEVLCLELDAATAAFKAALQKYSRAEAAKTKALPRPPLLLRSTKKNHDDVKYFPSDRRQGIAISVAEIRRQKETILKNYCKVEVVDGVKQYSLSEAGFPQTDEQRAQLKRLDARIPIAIAYDTAIYRLETRLKIDQLDLAVHAASLKQMALAARLVRLQSRSRDDLLAKVRCYQADPELYVDCAEHGDLAENIVGDLARLAAASVI